MPKATRTEITDSRTKKKKRKTTTRSRKENRAEDDAPLTPRSCRTSADPSETSRLDLGGTASRRVVAEVVE